jgi:DNA-directed RNA polymerase specialized sigma24 family protein
MSVGSDLDRDDDALLRALREGDERVFGDLVGRWSHIMLCVALSRVESRAVAEEVVQDMWLTVLRSLDRFERRSTLRTWVLGIVVNLARSRARAERREIPVSSEPEPSVDQARFLPASHPDGLPTGRSSPLGGVHRRTNSLPPRPARSSSRRSTHSRPHSVKSSCRAISRACHPPTSVTSSRSRTHINESCCIGHGRESARRSNAATTATRKVPAFAARLRGDGDYVIDKLLSEMPCRECLKRANDARSDANDDSA